MANQDDPLGLMGDLGVNPFEEPAAITPATATPTDPAPLTTPGFVPVEDYRRLEGEVARLKPLEGLTWIGEMVQANPALKDQITRAIFNAGAGVGAPPTVAAPSGPTPDAIAQEEQRMRALIQAKLDAGDVTGAMLESAKMGATMARATMTADFESRAQPFVTQTAHNSVEGWYNAKRVSAPLFAKVESKVRAFVAQTPPQTMAQLIQSGSLNQALEAAYKQILGDVYDEGYSRALADGRIKPQAQQNPPPYSYTGGGPTTTAPTTEPDDADDKEFVKLATAAGITVKMGRNGEYVAESSK